MAEPGKRVIAHNTTRLKIISEADRLFYQRGFEHTSFADVAAAVGISRGNFYYHFKTKDEILLAVIAKRIDDRAGLLANWASGEDNPVERIRSFIDILAVNDAKIRKYGCPVGSLHLELAKLNHPGESGAREIYDLFRNWLRDQFTAMGHQQDADNLAIHLLARSQGAAMIGRAYPDEDFMETERNQMHAWLDAVAAPPI